jgi:hypothetical protein
VQQFDLIKKLDSSFLTFDLVEDLLDLLLAPIAVDVHLEDAGLPIWR